GRRVRRCGGVWEWRREDRAPRAPQAGRGASLEGVGEKCARTTLTEGEGPPKAT
ncbi:hypothetical protein P7K49_028309, partial [Saguinus oedipus]